MPRAVPSLLEHALLALAHQEPRSGYALRRVFATTPMGHYSDSPGSIYPALDRLARRGWLSAAVHGAGSLRPRRVFSITPAGLDQLEKWLSARITADDVMWRMDDVMLRFAFVADVLGLAAALAFSCDLEGALAAHVRQLTRFYAAAARAMPVTGRLALASGVEMYEAQHRWAVRAVRELRAHERAARTADRAGRAGGARVPRR